MANITQYTIEQKNEAAILYAIEGSYKRVATKLGYPKDTVYSWSKNYEGWDALITQVQTEKAAEHVANYTKIVDKAQAITLEKLDDCTASQASLVACQAQDKALLLLGRPTSIRSAGGTQALQAAADLFHALANDKVLVPKSKVIDGSLDKGE